MNIKEQIIKLMKRANGVTIGELEARGINRNTARREVNVYKGESIKRKCRATGYIVTAYIWNDLW